MNSVVVVVAVVLIKITDRSKKKRKNENKTNSLKSVNFAAFFPFSYCFDKPTATIILFNLLIFFIFFFGIHYF